jgi:hypothetical protein
MPVERVPYTEYIIEDEDANIHHSVSLCDGCYALIPFWYWEQHADWHRSLNVLHQEDDVATTTKGGS